MSIQHLLVLRGPAAILRRVRPIIVDALNAVQIASASIVGRIARLRTHISVERLERLQPAVTDRDAATSVVFPVARVWVSAALLHALPHSVLWCGVRALSTHPVFVLQACSHFAAKAATTFRSAAAQHQSAYDADRSAVAPTFPVRWFSVWDNRDGYETAEALAG